jgi:hypothetical protein
MRTPRKTTAILLVGGVALASAGYAIGTQAGGGSAAAGDSSDDARRFGPGEPFDDLADALGVDAGELRDALADFGSRHRTERKDTFAAALADALGKSTEEVERALEERHEAARSAFARRLAAALDLEPADVEAALEKVMDGATPDRMDGPRDFVDDLAGELGVSADRLEDALREVRPPGRRGDCPGPGLVEPDLRGLAAALDVTQAKLREALREMWDERRTHRADVSDELAEFLAGRFNLSVGQVEEALDDTFPPPPERGLRGGPGPGFGPPALHTLPG